MAFSKDLPFLSSPKLHICSDAHLSGFQHFENEKHFNVFQSPKIPTGTAVILGSAEKTLDDKSCYEFNNALK